MLRQIGRAHGGTLVTYTTLFRSIIRVAPWNHRPGIMTNRSRLSAGLWTSNCRNPIIGHAAADRKSTRRYSRHLHDSLPIYYPACSLESSARDYDESIKAVCRALDIQLQEPDNWTCCGRSEEHTAVLSSPTRLSSDLLSGLLPGIIGPGL